MHERLAAVRLDVPRVDRGEVELALWRHLAAIGAETSSVAWAEDVEDGFERVRRLVESGDRVWTPTPSGWDRFSLWRPDGPIAYPARDLVARQDPFGMPVVRVARASLGRRWRVHRTSRTHSRWRVGFRWVADPVSVYRVALAAADDESLTLAGRPERLLPATGSLPGNWWQERDRERRSVRTYEAARYRLQTLEPLVRAWESGLFLFWVVEYRNWSQRTCIAVPRPTLHTAEGRLHRDEGPAVEWSTGTSYWFRDGIHVPKRVAARSSEQARLQVLVRTRNQEFRRVLLDRIGYQRFLELAGATLVNQDDYGRLWRCHLQVDGEPLHAVEVANATPEPDGSYRRSFLRVPPATTTAREAVAWTFGFDDENDYIVSTAS